MVAFARCRPERPEAAVTSMTPIQYQKQIRLQTARTLLMSATEDVVAVGFAVGYQSPSQFSREYRRQFGEAPGRDRKRLHEMKGVERGCTSASASRRRVRAQTVGEEL